MDHDQRLKTLIRAFFADFLTLFFTEWAARLDLANVEWLDKLRFQYLYVALLGLDGVEYVEGENWLGVALSALMKTPPERVPWLGAEALRRLAQAPLNEQERFFLGECVQAYLPSLDEEQRRQYENLLIWTQPPATKSSTPSPRATSPWSTAPGIWNWAARWP